jgi:UDP-glucuronate 4-epimerase
MITFQKSTGKLMILVTGAAGFIGFHVAKRLLERGDRVLGIDNLNEYYDVTLKKARLNRLEENQHFQFECFDIAHQSKVASLFERHSIRRVIHLAAQAGVRYSLVNPHAYTESNITGFLNILEGCRAIHVEHLVFASSSSVYGGNTRMPFSVQDNVDHPVSLYAASKKANELMAHAYAHLYRIPSTGLRFFTVYGPWGRPDMALFLFTRAILENKPIDVFNFGRVRRDFTYIDDIASAIIQILDRPAEPEPCWASDAPSPNSSSAPFRLYNIGHHQPVDILQVIEILEETLGRKAQKNFLPMQPGDVPETYADIEDLTRDFGIIPTTSIESGIVQFVRWYKEYYSIA